MNYYRSITASPSGGGGGGGGSSLDGKTTEWVDEAPDTDDVEDDEPAGADAVIDTGIAGGSPITGGFMGYLTEPSVIATALATVVVILGAVFHFKK